METEGATGIDEGTATAACSSNSTAEKEKEKGLDGNDHETVD
jgi:hypothetical protein